MSINNRPASFIAIYFGRRCRRRCRCRFRCRRRCEPEILNMCVSARACCVCSLAFFGCCCRLPFDIIHTCSVPSAEFCQSVFWCFFRVCLCTQFRPCLCVSVCRGCIFFPCTRLFFFTRFQCLCLLVVRIHSGFIELTLTLNEFLLVNVFFSAIHCQLQPPVRFIKCSLQFYCLLSLYLIWVIQTKRHRS